MPRNERVQVFDDNGNPKPGGELLPDPLFMVVEANICPYCKKVYKGNYCDCPKRMDSRR